MKAVVFTLAVLFTAACGPNQRILDSAASPTPDAGAPSALSSFDQEVEAMRTANFNFIYVFRRKDGAAINAADKKTAVELIPPEMNRRKLADDGKAIIVGSNYRMASENLKLLEENFALQDFSKPESEIIANATVNTQ